MPTTAITIGIISAGTQIASSAIQSHAASNATKAETAAGQQALQVEQQQYQQGRSDLAPYRQVGSGALSKLGQIFGVPMTDPTSIPTGPASPTALASSNGLPLSLRPGTLATPGSTGDPRNLGPSLGTAGARPSSLASLSGSDGAAPVRVQAPDGNIYSVPPSQVAAAQQQGGQVLA
jgi:hypothetical protein